MTSDIRDLGGGQAPKRIFCTAEGSSELQHVFCILDERSSIEWLLASTGSRH
jgi:hypothetical protein